MTALRPMSDPATTEPKAPVLRFEPDMFSPSNYTLEPHTGAARTALGLTLCMGSLSLVADAAYRRVGYGNTDYGFGLDDYPTRPDRAGIIRYWRWQWVEKRDAQGRGTGKHRTKTRRYHLSEAVYMGVLAGVLREHGWLEDAAKIAALMPAEPITVRYAPTRTRGNYQFTDYSREHDHCLNFILGLGLEQARALALSQSGTETLRHNPDQTLTLNWATANPTEVSLSAYLDVLEQLLALHRLPSARGDHSPVPTVLYKPQLHHAPNYHLSPRTQTTVGALETLLAFPWLGDLAKTVLQHPALVKGSITRAGHGFMLGEDTVRITHRHGPRRKGGLEFEAPKAEFVSVFVRLLEAQGLNEYAEQMAGWMPLEPIDLQWRPDPFGIRNYRITPFDARAADCLETILCRNDLQQPRDEARRKLGFRSGYYMVHGLDWRGDGSLRLLLPDGNDRTVPEGLYLGMLEQVLKLNGLEGVGA